MKCRSLQAYVLEVYFSWSNGEHIVSKRPNTIPWFLQLSRKQKVACYSYRRNHYCAINKVPSSIFDRLISSTVTQTPSESRTSARHGGDKPPQQKLLVKGALLDGSAYVANGDHDMQEMEHNAAA